MLDFGHLRDVQCQRSGWALHSESKRRDKTLDKHESGQDESRSDKDPLVLTRPLRMMSDVVVPKDEDMSE